MRPTRQSQGKQKKDRRLLVLLFFIVLLLLSEQSAKPAKEFKKITWSQLTSDELPVLLHRGSSPATRDCSQLSPQLAFLLGEKLAINRATSKELELLPGIGPALAQRIVDFRRQHGHFSSSSDLQNVTGIGPKVTQSLAHHVEYSP
jgi:comEA protein